MFVFYVSAWFPDGAALSQTYISCLDPSQNRTCGLAVSGSSSRFTYLRHKSKSNLSRSWVLVMENACVAPVSFQIETLPLTSPDEPLEPHMLDCTGKFIQRRCVSPRCLIPCHWFRAISKHPYIPAAAIILAAEPKKLPVNDRGDTLTRFQSLSKKYLELFSSGTPA